ncbi:UNVERIFIED_CONTAM: Major allergen Pru ar 1 [Sesamum latifolium]|uniref:Major allergen Pru ar 1 n=1 Tax=Sesamum latifolium TaxID=2727402 RepID=A0AAW2YC19_9LAMI
MENTRLRGQGDDTPDWAPPLLEGGIDETRGHPLLQGRHPMCAGDSEGFVAHIGYQKRRDLGRRWWCWNHQDHPFRGGSHYKSAKHRVDALDTENLTHSYTIVEGDALAGILESITYHVKIVPTEDGGCICKNRSIYHTKGDVEINEEKIKEGKEKAMQMFKAIEAYLQANPDA